MLSTTEGRASDGEIRRLKDSLLALLNADTYHADPKTNGLRCQIHKSRAGGGLQTQFFTILFRTTPPVQTYHAE